MTELNAYWFVIHDDKFVLIREGEKLSLPSTPEIGSFVEALTFKHHVGTLQNIPSYCAYLPDATTLPPNYELHNIRKVLLLLGVEWYRIVIKAYSIVNWDRNHQFCGRCGHVTEHKSKIFERICTHCGLMFYPRISPSVIVLIHRGDELLMARSPHFAPGAYGLIAGFVEIGESLEDAIHREVKEEVDLQIKNLTYFDSQPWPFPDSLMVGFTAEYLSGELKVDHNELEAAGWYRYDNLPGRPSVNFSISARLIDHFIAMKKSERIKQ